MNLGFLGRKCGMTHVFFENGTFVPVTVIHFDFNYISQIKTIFTDGYNSIQMSTGIKKRICINEPEIGHFLKSKIPPCRFIHEFRLDLNEVNKFKLGSIIDVSSFKIGKKVDVTGISKGKGFQGVIKRYNFKMQDATHGNSLSHRAHGSTGQNQTPGRVFKNKKMAGHMGFTKNTVHNLEIIRVYLNNGLFLIKGSIPGCKGSYVIVRNSIKV